MGKAKTHVCDITHRAPLGLLSEMLRLRALLLLVRGDEGVRGIGVLKHIWYLGATTRKFRIDLHGLIRDSRKLKVILLNEGYLSTLFLDSNSISIMRHHRRLPSGVALERALAVVHLRIVQLVLSFIRLQFQAIVAR